MVRALLALCGLVLNAAFAGPLPWYEAIGFSRISRQPARILRELERKLNREHRTASEREGRGLALVIMAFIISGMLGLFIDAFAVQGIGGFIQLVILTFALPVRPTFDLATLIRKYIQLGDLPAARQWLKGSPWRHHALLDEYGLARAAIEIIAIHFSEKILAPILWYVLLGLPGLFICKSITLMQESFAKPGVHERDFTKAITLTHHLLHFIPSRISAFLWLASSLFLPAANSRIIMRQIAKGLLEKPPQTMELLSAASVLRLSLGGPTSIYSRDSWIGEGSPKPTPADIKRSLFTFGLLNLLLFVGLGLLL